MTRVGTIVALREGRIGRIMMNRPSALNALDLPMLQGIGAALDQWHEDPEIHAVVIQSEGDRAFCAGGDIRAMRQHALAGDVNGIERYFACEYALNLTIATYPKPYVALVDGFCMGGGMGVSIHGAARVATERATFAMPETAIGFFPDIGASFFLPRLPGSLGMNLGLSGTRVVGAAAISAGLATHFVPAASLADLSDALARDGVAVLADAATPVTGGIANRSAIDRCFSADSVPEILGRLEREESDWANTCRTTLRAMSPSALLWSFALIRAGASRTLPQCLQAELALTRHVARHPDFSEGVRAMVVDKDRHPRWSPGTLEEVDPAAIASLSI